MRKKFLLVGILSLGIVFILVFAVRLVILRAENKDAGTEISHVKPEIGKLPYYNLIPIKDGNYFNFNIYRLPQDASAEYEITYQALDPTGDNITQGIMGNIVAGGNGYTKEHVFGTCSTNVCKYDKGVEFGSVLVKLIEPKNEYESSFEFHLQNLTPAGGVLTSKDEKISLEVPKNSISGKTYFIVHSTEGLPTSIKEKILAGPYGFFTSGEKKLSSDAILTFEVPQNSVKNNVFVWGWDDTDKKWVEFVAEVNGQKVTSKVNLFTTYIVVEKEGS